MKTRTRITLTITGLMPAGYTLKDAKQTAELWKLFLDPHDMAADVGLKRLTVKSSIDEVVMPERIPKPTPLCLQDCGRVKGIPGVCDRPLGHEGKHRRALP